MKIRLSPHALLFFAFSAFLFSFSTLHAQTDAKAQKYAEKGHSYYQEADYTKAIKFYSKAIEYAPAHGMYYMHRAKSHAQRDNVDAATIDFNLASEFSPEESEIFYERSRFLRRQRDVLGALEDLEKAVALNPTAKHHYELGMLNMYLEDEATALHDFGNAISLDKDHLEARKILAEMYFDGGEFDKAIEHYTYLSEQPSTRKKGLYNRGICYLNTEQWEESLEDMEAYLEEAPNSFRANKYAALALRGMGKQEEALSYLTKCIALQPSSAKAYLERGYQRIFMLDYENALGDNDTAIKKNPADADAWAQRYRLHMYLAQPDSAMSNARMARALQPQNAEHYYNIGMAFVQNGLPDSATYYAERMLKYDRNSLYGIQLYVMQNLWRRDYPAAYKWAMRSIESHPADPSSVSNLGYTLLLMDSFERAELYLKRRHTTALKTHNPLAIAYAKNNLGYCLYKLGEKEKGKMMLEEALELAPDNLYTDFYLGMIAMDEGRTKEACAIKERLEASDFRFLYGNELDDLNPRCR